MGEIFERDDADPWRRLASIKPQAAQRFTASATAHLTTGRPNKRGFTTKRDADAFAATVEVAKLTGEYVAPTLGNVTVGELGPAWLARARGHLKPAGFANYDNAWRTHVEPRWAALRINGIRFTDVQSWISELASRRGASTVRTAYMLLARILDDAVRDRLLSSNPARGVKLPKRPPARHVYLTPAQLDALARESGRYHSLVLALGVGGLRWERRRRYGCPTSISCVAGSR